MDLDKYICLQTDKIIDAIKKINANKSSFLIVVDSKYKILGTLTDGDIRRALLKNVSINDDVNKAYKSEYTSLNINQTIGVAIELFKNNRIKFLPIIDDDKLVNVITKSQLNSLLLQDIRADLNYDFSSLDDNIVNNEIYSRPWGFYKTTVLNNYYQSKVITIYPDEQLSLQSHNYRDEYWIIVHGNGLVTIDNSEKKVKPGDVLSIPKNVKHRIKNIDNKESLIITEVQLGDYFGEDDIIRYEDKYGRK